MQVLMDKFGVKVTPEVIVLDQTSDKVVYQGRIANTYIKVGRRRTVTTSHDLENALVAVSENRLPDIPYTEAVGCFITPLSADLKNAVMCAPSEKSNIKTSPKQSRI